MQLDFSPLQENAIQINLQKCFPFLLKVIHVRSLTARLHDVSTRVILSRMNRSPMLNSACKRKWLW